MTNPPPNIIVTPTPRPRHRSALKRTKALNSSFHNINGFATDDQQEIRRSKMSISFNDEVNIRSYELGSMPADKIVEEKHLILQPTPSNNSSSSMSFEIPPPKGVTSEPTILKSERAPVQLISHAGSASMDESGLVAPSRALSASSVDIPVPRTGDNIPAASATTFVTVASKVAMPSVPVRAVRVSSSSSLSSDDSDNDDDAKSTLSSSSSSPSSDEEEVIKNTDSHKEKEFQPTPSPPVMQFPPPASAIETNHPSSASVHIPSGNISTSTHHLVHRYVEAHQSLQQRNPASPIFTYAARPTSPSRPTAPQVRQIGVPSSPSMKVASRPPVSSCGPESLTRRPSQNLVSNGIKNPYDVSAVPRPSRLSHPVPPAPKYIPMNATPSLSPPPTPHGTSPVTTNTTNTKSASRRNIPAYLPGLETINQSFEETQSQTDEGKMIQSNRSTDASYKSTPMPPTSSNGSYPEPTEHGRGVNNITKFIRTTSMSRPEPARSRRGSMEVPPAPIGRVTSNDASSTQPTTTTSSVHRFVTGTQYRPPVTPPILPPAETSIIRSEVMSSGPTFLSNDRRSISVTSTKITAPEGTIVGSRDDGSIKSVSGGPGSVKVKKRKRKEKKAEALSEPVYAQVEPRERTMDKVKNFVFGRSGQ